MESEKKKENCEIEKIELPNKICQASCRVCRCDFIEEIHLMRKNGSDYKSIIEEVKKLSDGKYILTPSSLCNHFQKYNELKSIASAKIIKHDLIDEATKRAAHSSAIIILIDEYLKLLKERISTGILKVNIGDMEKLFNIKYKLLEGGGDEDKDLLAVFQKSVDKYGLETSQGVLFGRPSSVVNAANEPQSVENSEERKEAEREERN